MLNKECGNRSIFILFYLEPAIYRKENDLFD